MSLNLVENVGFEPTVHITAYDGLANRCLRPLSQLSIVLLYTKPIVKVKYFFVLIFTQ